MARVSIISMAAGTMPAATTSDTTSPAAAIDGKSASRVRTDSGARISRTVTCVTIPSVPSEPSNTPRRSGPACSPVSVPTVTTVPSASTTSSGQHVVGGEPVLEAVRAAGVLRDVAADRAHLLAGRVGRVVEPVRRGRLVIARLVTPGSTTARRSTGSTSRTRLSRARLITTPSATGSAPPERPGARPARDERHLVLVAHPHGRGHLLGVAGEQHQLRHDAVAGEPVALVGAALHRVGDHVRGGQRLLERLPHRTVERHASPPRGG